METSIFNYGELPEFNKFSSDRINQEFPRVIEKINLDFKKIEKFLSNYLKQENLEWDKVINPLNEVNEIPRPEGYSYSYFPESYGYGQLIYGQHEDTTKLLSLR